MSKINLNSDIKELLEENLYVEVFVRDSNLKPEVLMSRLTQLDEDLTSMMLYLFDEAIMYHDISNINYDFETDEFKVSLKDYVIEQLKDFSLKDERYELVNIFC